MPRLEPRHPSWFSDAADALLTSYRAGRVGADPAIVHGGGAPSAWPDLQYFRPHGRPRVYWSPYTQRVGPAHPQGRRYVVTAASGVNLAAHVNHQVSVTGTAAGGHAMADQAHVPAARPGDPKAAPGMTGDKAWETLTATSGTMVSATCSATE